VEVEAEDMVVTVVAMGEIEAVEEVAMVETVVAAEEGLEVNNMRFINVM
jgi:hypothetical protein